MLVTNKHIHKMASDLIASWLCKIAKSRDKLVNVTGPDKTGLIALFCISRNTDFNIECTILLWWLDTVTPDILYNKYSYVGIIS